MSIDTSVSDPSLFEVNVSEPRQHRVDRSIEAVIGPEDLHWALVYYEPASGPLAQQATCTEGGCRLDLVALFEPRRNDWWLPLIRPASDARPDPFEQRKADIEVRRVEVTAFEGSFDRREALGTLNLHLEAEPGTTEVALWIIVFPDKGPFISSSPGNWPIPEFRTDDGQNPKMYRWFELDCDPDRCQRDVTVTWNLLENQDGTDVGYSGLVVGGVGDGIASETPPVVVVGQ